MGEIIDLSGDESFQTITSDSHRHHLAFASFRARPPGPGPAIVSSAGTETVKLKPTQLRLTSEGRGFLRSYANLAMKPMD